MVNLNFEVAFPLLSPFLYRIFATLAPTSKIVPTMPPFPSTFTLTPSAVALAALPARALSQGWLKDIDPGSDGARSILLVTPASCRHFLAGQISRENNLNPVTTSLAPDF